MERNRLTIKRIESITCRPGKRQDFHWDGDVPGLGVRVTENGAKSFVFEGKLRGKTIRMTLGDVRVWPLSTVWDDTGKREVQRGAREEAKRLRTLIDQGKDPRQVAADEITTEQSKRIAQASAQVAKEHEERRSKVTLGEAWETYIANPPKRNGKSWGKLHMRDHRKLIAPELTKGERTSTAGALASLAPLPLKAITSVRVGKWLEVETAHRPTQAALAFRLLRAFLNWCDGKEDYKGLAAPDACARKVGKEHLKSTSAKTDSLEKAQLKTWFDAVRKIQNKTIAAYLQGLLITGARREELAGLRWTDVDFQWNSLTIHDKVSGSRTLPLTPYFAELLRGLKKRNDTPPNVRKLNALKEAGDEWKPSPWVFASTTSASGRLAEPSIAHRKALAAVGLPPVTLHGLRRSFGSLSEWCEVPTGVVAQIMGHKPSATAEKHYRVRPLDLLRKWHVTIEEWMLTEAGLKVTQAEEAAKPVLTQVA